LLPAYPYIIYIYKTMSCIRIALSQFHFKIIDMQLMFGLPSYHYSNKNQCLFHRFFPSLWIQDLKEEESVFPPPTFFYIKIPLNVLRAAGLLCSFWSVLVISKIASPWSLNLWLTKRVLEIVILYIKTVILN
jgi:hypothetical protein